jgi:hypothetical protein
MALHHCPRDRADHFPQLEGIPLENDFILIDFEIRKIRAIAYFLQLLVS